MTVEKPVEKDAPKWLLRLVYIMGGVLVLLFIGVIVGLFFKLRKPPAPIIVPPPLQLNFSGADVKLMALDGNRLAITAPHDIFVFDVPSGKLILRLPLN
jgi:hypothetical protein